MRRPVAALVLAALAGCGSSEQGSDAAKRTTTTAGAGAAATAQRAADARRRVLEPARACLQKAGYRIAGGSPAIDDTDAPDYEFVLNGHGGGAFIAFYDELARAERYEPAIRRNAKKFKRAAVERQGRITIVWVRLPAALRTGVRACVFARES